MGAEIDYRTYTNFTKEAAEQRFLEDQKQSGYEDGHSYSGCIGVMPPGVEWTNKTFTSASEASDYIMQKHEKWEPAMGVAYVQTVEEDEPKETKGFVIGGWCSS